jgi:hypothetical protein
MTLELLWGLVLLFFVVFALALSIAVAVLAFAAGFLEGKQK